MTTPRLIRFNDTQKPMDVISDRRDNSHVFDLPFIPWLYFRSYFIRLLPVFITTMVCRPNHRRKNVTPRIVLLLSMHICMRIYTCLYIGITLSIKNTFHVLFLFFVSHVVLHWENGMKIRKRQRERVCRERKENQSESRKRRKICKSSKFKK